MFLSVPDRCVSQEVQILARKLTKMSVAYSTKISINESQLRYKIKILILVLFLSCWEKCYYFFEYLMQKKLPDNEYNISLHRIHNTHDFILLCWKFMVFFYAYCGTYELVN